MEITQQACSPREILARHRENEAGVFRAAGTRARERLSPPRRESSNDPLKTAAIRTAIAVIATLIRAGCMSGDHG